MSDSESQQTDYERKKLLFSKFQFNHKLNIQTNLKEKKNILKPNNFQKQNKTFTLNANQLVYQVQPGVTLVTSEPRANVYTNNARVGKYSQAFQPKTRVKRAKNYIEHFYEGGHCIGTSHEPINKNSGQHNQIIDYGKVKDRDTSEAFRSQNDKNLRLREPAP